MHFIEVMTAIMIAIKFNKDCDKCICRVGMWVILVTSTVSIAAYVMNVAMIMLGIIFRIIFRIVLSIPIYVMNVAMITFRISLFYIALVRGKYCYDFQSYIYMML